MNQQIIGISGSQIPNSNLDRAVKAVLEASGLDYEFIKLSDYTVRPCLACKRCAKDNICKQDDDFALLCKKVVEADALVIRAHATYGSLNGFTKTFMERLWSLRHVNKLLKDKPVVILTTGLFPPIFHKPIFRYTGLGKLLKRKLPSEKVAKDIVNQLGKAENMNIIGKVTLKGNLPCLTCGQGDNCQCSGVKIVFGKNAKASADLCIKVEDQERKWQELHRLGTKISKILATKPSN